jgi:importin-5
LLTYVKCQVRHSSLRASAALLLSSDEHQLVPSASLLSSMLDTLPSVPQSRFPQFMSSLNRLVMVKPALFQPHFQPLLSFLGPRILPNTDGASTPTESMPASTYPSTKSKSSKECTDGLDEEKEGGMKAALEFMITLSEAGSGIVNEVDGWVAAIVRGCLEGMGTLRDDDLDEWLEADVRLCLFATNYRLMELTQAIDNVMDDSYARVCEQALRRLAAAVREPLLSCVFAYIPGMVANYDWRLRHAGLAAIAQVVVFTRSLTVCSITHSPSAKI